MYSTCKLQVYVVRHIQTIFTKILGEPGLASCPMISFSFLPNLCRLCIPSGQPKNFQIVLLQLSALSGSLTQLVPTMILIVLSALQFSSFFQCKPTYLSYHIHIPKIIQKINHIFSVLQDN